ncbi:MAG: transcription elongation factor GreA [Actinobacteria bacterium]|nr:transcription elongation factor GreA [Actinomycetota bacterium]
MSTDHVEMSRAAYEALEAEIEKLETVDRPAIAAKIQAAREDGDLKENAEYHAAKNDQSFLETKILKLRDQRQRAAIVETISSGTVMHGSKVRLKHVDAGKEVEYTIVAPHEADAGAGRISSVSPVAEALLGSKSGETVKVSLPNGKNASFEILTIS